MTRCWKNCVLPLNVNDSYATRRNLTTFFPFLPARCYASAGLCDSDVSVCPSVYPSVRMSVCHTAVLCLAERKQDREVYTPSDSPMILVSGKVWVVEKFSRGHPKGTCQMRVGWIFSAIFDQYVVVSRKRCSLNTKLLEDGNRKP